MKQEGDKDIHSGYVESYTFLSSHHREPTPQGYHCESPRFWVASFRMAKIPSPKEPQALSPK